MLVLLIGSPLIHALRSGMFAAVPQSILSPTGNNPVTNDRTVCGFPWRAAAESFESTPARSKSVVGDFADMIEATSPLIKRDTGTRIPLSYPHPRAGNMLLFRL